MIKGTIVLEGGARRGIFTSGVLDFLMEQELYFSDVIGVSFGACNASSYVSKQHGRMRDCTAQKETNYGMYAGFRKFLKDNSILDMDLLFDKYPNEYFPLGNHNFVSYVCYHLCFQMGDALGRSCRMRIRNFKVFPCCRFCSKPCITPS